MRRSICLVILGGLLLAAPMVGADADEQAIRSTISKAYENWGAMNPDANDPYYAADANAVWFDIAPMQYVGWTAYKDGVKRMFSGLEGVSLKIHDDLAVHRAGKTAWATFTWTAELRIKGGKVEHSEGRATEILEKRKGKWVIVHEHASVPAPSGP